MTAAIALQPQNTEQAAGVRVLAGSAQPGGYGRSLGRRLAAEDLAEETGRLAPDDRLTCHVHGRWIHQCVSSPLHVSPVTRHRWCRSCTAELTVIVDELTGTVAMRCPRCGDGGSAATSRLVAACRASLALGRDARHLSAA